MNHRKPFIFTDTSAWSALAYAGDPYHQAAQTFIASAPRLMTTNFVIDETITLVLAHLGYWPARELGERLWNGRLTRVVYVSKADQHSAWELFKKYDDKEFSFTDCTSFVVMERLGLLHAFAFDEHFEQTSQFIRLPRA